MLAQQQHQQLGLGHRFVSHVLQEAMQGQGSVGRQAD
jgi:hypothetical protein